MNIEQENYLKLDILLKKRDALFEIVGPSLQLIEALEKEKRQMKKGISLFRKTKIRALQDEQTEVIWVVVNSSEYYDYLKTDCEIRLRQSINQYLKGKGLNERQIDDIDAYLFLSRTGNVCSGDIPDYDDFILMSGKGSGEFHEGEVLLLKQIAEEYHTTKTLKR